MRVFISHTLLSGLESNIHSLLTELDGLKRKDIDWNRQLSEKQWSPVQIIEHLNSYNRYYLPHIENVILNQGKNYKSRDQFKSSLFGNYFTKMMQPDANGKISNKMNAPKDHRPPVQLNSESVLTEFEANERRLIGYLEKSKNTDIQKLKVPISISRFIKLSIGDTFRFLIAHQQRHFLQLTRTVDMLSK
ncbi:MAG: DinB family protein [Bacteroidetes bacterium]|nr:DinB family protein [Bacteroidota bacterium]